MLYRSSTKNAQQVKFKYEKGYMQLPYKQVLQYTHDLAKIWKAFEELRLKTLQKIPYELTLHIVRYDGN